MTVTVNLPDYLHQWAAYRFGSPMVPVKGSPVASFLRSFLRHKSERPSNYTTQLDIRGNVNFGSIPFHIVIPHFPGRDPDYYNYLSPVAESQLRDIFRSLFDVQLYTDLTRFQSLSVKLNDLVYSWLDSNGIDPTEANWLAVTKRLQLLRRRASESYRKARKRQSPK